jgi:beta-lactamase class A
MKQLQTKVNKVLHDSQKVSVKYKIATYCLFFVIVVLVMYSFLLKNNSTAMETSNQETKKFLNPALKVLDKKDLIVNFQELRDSLTSKYEVRNDYLISIYFEYLPTGANIAINKDERIWPASLIKIPIAMAVMKKVQDSKWKLTNELVILDQDKDNEYGSLYKEPTGTTLTIQKFQNTAKSNKKANICLQKVT